jgi:hypothetical protein
MTNNELFFKLCSIDNECNNIFDKYCEFKKIEEEYKTTEFYASYRYSIIDAYNLYIQDTTSIGHLLRDFKNIDLPSIANLFADKLDITKTFEGMDSNTSALLKEIWEQYSK